MALISKQKLNLSVVILYNNGIKMLLDFNFAVTIYLELYQALTFMIKIVTSAHLKLYTIA